MGHQESRRRLKDRREANRAAHLENVLKVTNRVIDKVKNNQPAVLPVETQPQKSKGVQ